MDDRVPGAACGGRLSYLIFQLARAHRAHAGELLRGLGLHPGQELLLMHLYDRDEQTQSELLGAVCLDHSTVSKALRRMEEAGLVTRRPAERDRRVLVVSLTAKGRALREPIGRMWARLEEVTAGGLDAAQIGTFAGLARTITRSIDDRDTTEESG
ncbi:MarR family transcriptional regulator [Actinosynnema sp. NPDC020468]|uniref:MarR family winged helix-turn-helix transcriptional regulator n=1 Tax=Actinosynnema sp. NPDC020468 TaxID=3154488 RepID=UPI0033E8033A